MISHQWNTAYDRIDEKHNMHTLIKDQRKGGLTKIIISRDTHIYSYINNPLWDCLIEQHGFSLSA